MYFTKKPNSICLGRQGLKGGQHKKKKWTYESEALETFSSINDLEAISDALVHSWVCLKD